MKRLVGMMSGVALVIWMAASLASAQGWGALAGTYSMTATGSCLHSTLGFTSEKKPITGSVVWGATVMPLGLWTFESDGTGSVTGTNYILDFPPGSALFGGPIARQSAIAFPFHYDVSEGVITVYPPAPPNLHGLIATDHKTLTLSNAGEVQSVGALGYAICDITRTLIRVGE